jgi:hypothetical protein
LNVGLTSCAVRLPKAAESLCGIIVDSHHSKVEFVGDPVGIIHSCIGNGLRRAVNEL